jgi:hypothetical protein
MLFCRHYFSPLNTFMRKGKDPEPDSVPDFDPDSHLRLMNPDRIQEAQNHPDPVPDPDHQHWDQHH